MRTPALFEITKNGTDLIRWLWLKSWQAQSSTCISHPTYLNLQTCKFDSQLQTMQTLSLVPKFRAHPKSSQARARIQCPRKRDQWSPQWDKSFPLPQRHFKCQTSLWRWQTKSLLFCLCSATAKNKWIECLKKQCKTQTVRFVFVGRHQLRCWETVAKPPFIH